MIEDKINDELDKNIDVNLIEDDSEGHVLKRKNSKIPVENIIQAEKIYDKEVRKPERDNTCITALIGIVSIGIIVASFYLMNKYFQAGRPFVTSQFWNMMWLVFGKVIFVLVVMIFLISLSYTFKKFPKFIANNAAIQLICNLSFSMYIVHYCV